MRRRFADDAGMSMIELVVGMALMVVVMTIFTGVIVTMNRSENKVEAVTSGSAQLSQAFLALDKSVRYAAAVGPPGTSSGDWYVEARFTNTGAQTCTQWRVHAATQQLQRRSWTVSGGAATQLTGWSQLAAGITNGAAAAGSADQPFALAATSADVALQRLTITLVAAPAATARTAVTFTALNSTVPSPAAPICQEAGRP